MIALAIGVPPLQFPLLVLVLRFLESLSHANARVSFGRVGDRLLISPRFHRAHHEAARGGQRSCNPYGAVFPWWDMLFGTPTSAAPMWRPVIRRDRVLATGSTSPAMGGTAAVHGCALHPRR